MRLCFGPRFAQRVGLRLAAAFGHGFGKVGKQNREPEPKRDLQSKTKLSCVVRRIPCELDRRQNCAHFDHEHHRIFDHRPRIQLAKRI